MSKLINTGLINAMNDREISFSLIVNGTKKNEYIFLGNRRDSYAPRNNIYEIKDEKCRNMCVKINYSCKNCILSQEPT